MKAMTDIHLIEPQPKVRLPDPRPKALTAWLGELPLANSQRCFDAIDAVLEAFNADARIPAATRLELAELLRPMVSLLVERAESHFMDAPLPYPPQVELYANQALHLTQQLGTAYGLAGLDPNYRPGWFEKSERHLTKSLYRALQQWGLVLLRTAQQYRTPTGEYWAMLYDLYRSVEIRNLLLARFDAPEEPASCQTALGLFKRILLFALTSTRHLRQRDMRHVYDLLGNLVDLAELSAESQRNGEPAEFFVRTDEARPPFYHHPEDGEDKSRRRFLFTGDLTSELSKQAFLKTADIELDLTGKDKNPIDEAALLRMVRNLEGNYKRKGERKSQNEICRCVLGLSHFINILRPPAQSHASGDPRALNPALVERLISTGIDFSPEDRQQVLPKDMFMEPEFGDRTLRSELAASKLLSKKALTREDIWQSKPGTMAHDKSEGAVVEARMTNASEHGYCLVWPSDQVAGIRIGELIGVLGGDKAHSSMGVIRWLQCGDGQFMLGVEQFTASAEVVDVLDRQMKPVARGLLMQPEPGYRIIPELLTLPGKVQVGNLVFVHNGDGQAKGRFFKVQRMNENTASYSRFGLVVTG